MRDNKPDVDKNSLKKITVYNPNIYIYIHIQNMLNLYLYSLSSQQATCTTSKTTQQVITKMILNSFLMFITIL